MSNFHFAKIIATVWPAISKETVLSKIINYVDIFRINLSHLNEESRNKYIDIINKVDRSKTIMIDTRWPEIRTQNISVITLSEWDEIEIKYSNLKEPNDKTIFVNYENIKEAPNSWKIFIDDNKIVLEIISNKSWIVTCKALNSWILGINKTLNFEWYSPKLPFLCDKDKTDIVRGIWHWISLIAASFIRNAEDIKILKEFLKEKWWEKIRIIAKIETKEALNDLDNIILESDWIMVARWDLWAHIPLEELPMTQLNIMKLCNKHGKPVMVATQIMESMIENQIPTRAEIDEIVFNMMNWIDAFLICEETAVWKFPAQTITWLHNTITKNQALIKHEYKLTEIDIKKEDNVKDYMIYNAYKTAKELGIKAIICPTENWYTPAKLSAMKPNVPIIAFARDDETYKYLNLLWAVKWYKVSTVFEYQTIKRIGKEMIRMMFKWDISLDDNILIINSSIAQNVPTSVKWLEIYKFKDL